MAPLNQALLGLITRGRRLGRLLISAREISKLARQVRSLMRQQPLMRWRRLLELLGIFIEGVLLLLRMQVLVLGGTTALREGVLVVALLRRWLSHAVRFLVWQVRMLLLP